MGQERSRRFAALLRGEKPERPVVFPMVVANHAAHLEGYAISEAVRSADVLARVLYSAYRFYGYDMVMVFTDTVVEAEAMGAQVLIPEDDDPFVLLPPRVSRLEPADPDRDARMPVVIDATRRLGDLLEGEAPILTSLKGPFSLASFLRGVEAFLGDLLDNPTRAREYLKVATDNQVAYAEAIVRCGGVPFIGDPVASGSMISPAMFREFAQPGVTQLVRAVHENGAKAGLHICGETRSILKDMAATGEDFLSIDEMDMAQARNEAGAGVVLMGNVSTALLLDGTPEQVEAASRECLSKAGPQLLLSSSCDVPADAPRENVQALVKAGREWQQTKDEG
jgi:uroporphyrinogen decarboxylase